MIRILLRLSFGQLRWTERAAANEPAEEEHLEDRAEEEPAEQEDLVYPEAESVDDSADLSGVPEELAEELDELVVI